MLIALSGSIKKTTEGAITVWQSLSRGFLISFFSGLGFNCWFGSPTACWHIPPNPWHDRMDRPDDRQFMLKLPENNHFINTKISILVRYLSTLCAKIPRYFGKVFGMCMCLVLSENPGENWGGCGHFHWIPHQSVQWLKIKSVIQIIKKRCFTDSFAS